MANYTKSFNFKNGVQVDDDHFIITQTGLVGIGTSLPDKLLDVHGNARVIGVLSAYNADVSGIITVGSNIQIDAASGIITATKFVGSAGDLTGVVAIATDGWVQNTGTLSTTASIGIDTSVPTYQLQVGEDPKTSIGVAITNGDLFVSGFTTTKDLYVSGISTFSNDLIIGTGATVGFGSTVYFPDDVKLRFGSDEDISIYHTGVDNQNYIDSIKGSLYLRANVGNDLNRNIYIQAKSGEDSIIANNDGSVQIFFDDNEKLTSTGYGITVSGVTYTDHLNVTGVSTFTGDVSFGSSASFGDNDKILLGDEGTEFQLYHDGSTSIIKSGEGNLNLQTASGEVILGNTAGEVGVSYKYQDGVEIRHANTTRFQTSGVGVTITGVTSTTDLDVTNNITVAGVSTFTGSVGFGTTVTIPNNAAIEFHNDVSGLKIWSGDRRYDDGVVTGDYSWIVHRDTTKPLLIESRDSSGIEFRYRTGSNSTNYTTSARLGYDDCMLSWNGEEKLYTIEDGIRVSSPSGANAGGGIYIGNSDPSNSFIGVGSMVGYPYTTPTDFSFSNNQAGNINFFLNANAGIQTGDFVWHKGKNQGKLMALTYEGYLGIGITNPTHNLSVVGTSTFTANAWFDNSVDIRNDLVVHDTLTVHGNFDVTSITSDITGNVTGTAVTTKVLKVESGGSETNAGFGIFQTGLGVNVADFPTGGKSLLVNSGHDDSVVIDTNGSVGIGTSVIRTGQDGPGRIGLDVVKGIVSQAVGVGTTNLRCQVDFADAGALPDNSLANIETRYMLLPKLTGTQRGNLDPLVTGALIYNTDTNKLNFYNGTAWEVVTSTAG